MSGMIRNEDIAYVRENVRIDDVVSDYLPLKHAGGDQKKGLCPFHDEKSPSFHVTLSKGYFHCFGCHKGGDVIKFLMDMDHISFVEAIEKLANLKAHLQAKEGVDRWYLDYRVDVFELLRTYGKDKQLQ